VSGNDISVTAATEITLPENLKERYVTTREIKK